MSDISVSEIGDFVVSGLGWKKPDSGCRQMDDTESDAGASYAFSGIDVRIIYLVHGASMEYGIPHCDTESTDPRGSTDRYYFADDCFNDDGSWGLFPKWTSDRLNHECGLFPVDNSSGYINVSEISAIWHSVNGIEYGRPAWLADAGDSDNGIETDI